jgi:hypothetical protein
MLANVTNCHLFVKSLSRGVSFLMVAARLTEMYVE